MSMTKANLKKYIEEMGMNTYTALANVYDDEDEEGHKNFNALWIRIMLRPRYRTAHGEWDYRSWFELHLYHEDEDAVNRILYLLMKYPWNQPAVITDDCSVLTTWTIGGTVVVDAGRFKFDAATETAIYTPGAYIGESSKFKVEIKMEISDVTKLGNFYLKATTDHILCGVYFDGSKLKLEADAVYDLVAAVNNTEYTVLFEVDLDADTVDISIDGTKYATAKPLFTLAKKFGYVRAHGANAANFYIDDLVIQAPPYINLDNYMKAPEFSEPKLMNKDGHKQYHYRITFEDRRWGLISE